MTTSAAAGHLTRAYRGGSSLVGRPWEDHLVLAAARLLAAGDA